MHQTGPDLKQKRDWVGAGAGFLFVVLTVVGLGVGGNHPDPTGPAETIRSYFLGDPFGVQAGTYIQSVAVLVLVVFGASIARRLWLCDRPALAAVAFGAILLSSSLTLIENALLSVLAFSVAGDGDAGAIKALYALRQPILLAYIYFPVSLFAFTLALGSLTAGVFPRWFGWLTAGVGLVLLIGASFPFTGKALPSVLGFLVLNVEALWLLLTSGLLLRRPAPA